MPISLLPVFLLHSTKLQSYSKFWYGASVDLEHRLFVTVFNLVQFLLCLFLKNKNSFTLLLNSGQ